MTLRPDLPLVAVPTRQAWRNWLAAEHERAAGVWAVTVKKSALAPGEDYVSARDLNEECLCVGWIDSKPGKVDQRRTALLCTPRRPGSGWSKVNKDRIERLLADGLVLPAGAATIEAAKAHGSWSMLDEIDALTIPDDLAAALAAIESARRHFDAFAPSARRGILEWIAQAKTEATRTKRIEETARLAGDNRRANQWPRA